MEKKVLWVFCFYLEGKNASILRFLTENSFSVKHFNVQMGS